MLYFTLNIIYKNSKVSKIFLKKPFKFELDNRISYLISSFILYLLMTNNILQKKSRKQNLVWFYDFGFIKIIFLLLIEFIAC